MRIKIKEGSNPWWAAYQVLNTKNPINGMSMSLDEGDSWINMAGPGAPAPEGFYFMKPDGIILNATVENGHDHYKIRVESDSGDIIVDMVGVVAGGETDAGANNDCGGEEHGFTSEVSTPVVPVEPIPITPTLSNSCNSFITNKTNWIGHPGFNAYLKVTAFQDISSFSISIHTDIPLTFIKVCLASLVTLHLIILILVLGSTGQTEDRNHLYNYKQSSLWRCQNRRRSYAGVPVRIFWYYRTLCYRYCIQWCQYLLGEEQVYRYMRI